MASLEGQLTSEYLYGFEGFEPSISENEYIGRIGNSKLFITGWAHCYDIWFGESKETAKYVGRVYGSYKFTFKMVPYANGEKRRPEFYRELRKIRKADVNTFNKNQNTCTLKIDRRRGTILFLLNR
ncbi:MAG: hypothetical protein ACM3KR_05595 [Deltaproteobacteria bacterium]